MNNQQKELRYWQKEINAMSKLLNGLKKVSSFAPSHHYGYWKSPILAAIDELENAIPYQQELLNEKLKEVQQ